jgi:hydrogenase maturation protein HypF
VSVGALAPSDARPRDAQRCRARVRVTGTVQGVGFRPYVYRLASDLGLAGFVFNDSHGVLLEAEGARGAVEALLARLGPDAPPLAVVEEVRSEECEPRGELGFAILESPHDGAAEAPVTPDAAICEECLGELFDPADRRFRYPFINCTNCGPRFTIVRGIPYDRPLTTMAAFQMCPRCLAEYSDPADRRFHAQPNACPDCGPSLALLQPDGRLAPTGEARDALSAAVLALRAGQIAAVKGIGGYHLACRADDELAVAELRARKHREDRPFALMVSSLEQAETLVRLGGYERALLSGPERPIVLAPRREGAPVAPSVAPAVPELGVMLAYSPLHHLLLRDSSAPLVMTSGNVSDEPIAYRDEDALARLAAIADLLLVHDRPIETRTDDSVMRVVATSAEPRRIFVRRSRGYVPASLPLTPAAGRAVLACGAELKNTFCLAKGGRAWVSHHIGDLENYETLVSFTEGIAHFERLFELEPEVLAHDLHPEYMSTKYALEREGVELVGVQHHHAHLAACLAEHGVTDRAVGAIFDGTGYGTDGTVWGGELLAGDLRDFRRVGMLYPVRLPGGASAIREPWRMACAWLAAACEQRADARGEECPAPPPLPSPLRGLVQERAWRQVARLARGGPNSPLTTSMGRLFDAVAAICGVRASVNYEGQAAVELEAACAAGAEGRYEIAVVENAGSIVLDPREAVRALAADVEAGEPVGVIASSFHSAVSSATVRACTRAAAAEGTERVVLSGGSFQNRRLLQAVSSGLTDAGLRVLVPAQLPVGDGGIAYGQAAVAAARMATAVP